MHSQEVNDSLLLPTGFVEHPDGFWFNSMHFLRDPELDELLAVVGEVVELDRLGVGPTEDQDEVWTSRLLALRSTSEERMLSE